MGWVGGEMVGLLLWREGLAGMANCPVFLSVVWAGGGAGSLFLGRAGAGAIFGWRAGCCGATCAVGVEFQANLGRELRKGSSGMGVFGRVELGIIC